MKKILIIIMLFYATINNVFSQDHTFENILPNPSFEEFEGQYIHLDELKYWFTSTLNTTAAALIPNNPNDFCWIEGGYVACEEPYQEIFVLASVTPVSLQEHIWEFN